MRQSATLEWTAPRRWRQPRWRLSRLRDPFSGFPYARFDASNMNGRRVNPRYKIHAAWNLSTSGSDAFAFFLLFSLPLPTLPPFFVSRDGIQSALPWSERVYDRRPRVLCFRARRMVTRDDQSWESSHTNVTFDVITVPFEYFAVALIRYCLRRR